MAYKMGVTTHLSSYPAEALGGLTLGVTPLEMAVVYATLADGGWRNAPIAITKVVFPDGHVDDNWGKPHRVKVLSEAITGEETSILHQNVLGGTAVRSAINCPTAAKTGTTSELVDAWLDGYNSQYSTVVWMGYPNKRVSMTERPRRTPAGRRAAGGHLARLHGARHRRQAVRAAEQIQRRHLLPAVLRQIRDHRPAALGRRTRTRATKKPKRSGGGSPKGASGKGGEHTELEVHEAARAENRPTAGRPPAPPAEGQTGGARRTDACGARAPTPGADAGSLSAISQAEGRAASGQAAGWDVAWRRRTRSNSRAR